MNPGKFWFSEPSPYVTHEPRLGRINRASPQFMSNNDGSWLGTSACIERITAMSSMFSATCGKSSLTSMPLWPYFLNLNGDANAAPVLRSVRGFSIGSNLPAYFWSEGFGSKVSTCDGPPLAKMWMMRLALPGKCGCFGASGLVNPSVARAEFSAPKPPNNAPKLSAPIPMPQRPKNSRLVNARCSKSALWCDPILQNGRKNVPGNSAITPILHCFLYWGGGVMEYW